jgi:hypothetical protein
MSAWTDFFAAVVGATSALLGLFFVSLSLNLATILANRGLPERALQALLQLLAALIVGLLLLMPGQSLWAAGLEILIVAVVMGLLGTVLAVRGLRGGKDHKSDFVRNLALVEISVVPWFVGGFLLLGGNAAGAYWLAVGICLSIVKAVIDSWVFLVEINR